MVARTGLLIVASLLLVVALTSALAPRETRSARGASAVAAAANNPDPPQKPGSIKPVDATIPPDRTIEATVGQVVNITASSDTQDVVDIPALGYDQAVGPELPAQLSVVAPEAGNYPIVLSYAGTRIATLKVTDPDDIAARASASAAPSAQSD